MPPQERQKLQPRSHTALNNVLQRYLKDRNMEGIRGIHNAITTGDRPKNTPGIGHLYPNRDKPWSNDPGSGSWWNASLPSGGNNSGVMAAMADNPMVQQAKGLYQAFDPWIPNLDGNSLGYEWQRPLLGGTLGYGADYDWDDEDFGAFFNWEKKLGG